MVDLSHIPNAPIKVIFAIHFLLATWGIQGYWSPDSYLFYNLMFFLTLLWAIYAKESDEPVQVAVFINTVSILLDVIAFSIYFPSSSPIGSERFSMGMAILNLVLRPVTALVLYRLYCDRAEALGNSVPNLFGQSNRSPYQDIDATHQSVPRTEIAGSSPFAAGGGDSKMPPPYHG